MNNLIWEVGGRNKFDWGVERINSIGKCFVKVENKRFPAARPTLPSSTQPSNIHPSFMYLL